MLRQGFRVLLVLTSVLLVALYLSVALPVARGTIHVAAADSIESAVLEQANRLHDRVPAYVEPASAASVVPMPGFPVAVALLVGVDDAQLWLVRQLALLATVVGALVIFGIVRMETGGWTLSLAAASLALFTPALFGAPPGAARPESIALLFVLLGFATLRFTIGVIGALGAGVLLSFAFFVHAPAVWFVAAAALSLAFEDRRRCTAFGIVALGLIGVGYIAMSRMFGPWFNFAAWDEPMRNLALAGVGVGPFAIGHLFGRLGLCTVSALLSCAIATQPWNERRGLWMWLALGSVVAGMATSLVGAMGLPLQSSFVALLLVGALALDLVARTLADSFGQAGHDGESVIFVVMMLQAFVFVTIAPMPAWLVPIFAAVPLG